MNKPTLVYHADWGSKPSKRWCAKATLGSDGRYTASAPTPVGELTVLLKNLRDEAGEPGTVFAGFDFPIGVPAHYAESAGIVKFREFLPQLGTGVWKNFYSVCDKPENTSTHRSPLNEAQGDNRAWQRIFAIGEQVRGAASRRPATRGRVHPA